MGEHGTQKMLSQQIYFIKDLGFCQSFVGGERFELPTFTLWERFYRPPRHHHLRRPPIIYNFLFFVYREPWSWTKSYALIRRASLTVWVVPCDFYLITRIEFCLLFPILCFYPYDESYECEKSNPDNHVCYIFTFHEIIITHGFFFVKRSVFVLCIFIKMQKIF